MLVLFCCVFFMPSVGRQFFFLALRWKRSTSFDTYIAARLRIYAADEFEIDMRILLLRYVSLSISSFIFVLSKKSTFCFVIFKKVYT